MTTTASATVEGSELFYLGEQGEWIAAEGHVDLEAFRHAASFMEQRDSQLSDDETILAGDEVARHVWWREEEIPGSGGESILHPAKEGDEGAAPYTVIDTGI